MLFKIQSRSKEKKNVLRRERTHPCVLSAKARNICGKQMCISCKQYVRTASGSDLFNVINIQPVATAQGSDLLHN